MTVNDRGKSDEFLADIFRSEKHFSNFSFNFFRVNVCVCVCCARLRNAKKHMPKKSK